MPNYDSTKKEILVTDNQGGLHRYLKGNPCPQGSQVDAEIEVLTGWIAWKSGNLQDGMEPDTLPGTIVIAEKLGSFRFWYEWVLDTHEGRREK